MAKINILIVVLAVLACLGLSYAQLRPETRAVVATTEDIPIYLDGVPTGSVAKTQPLVGRLRSLSSKLDTNANLASGGLANIGNIVFSPDDNISMTDFGRVWDSVKEFFNYPPFDRIALWGGNSCAEAGGDRHPFSGSVFVLSNSLMSPDDLTRIKSGSKCWVKTQIYTDDSPSPYQRRFLKSHRTAYTSLEITQSGSYLLNEQVKNARLRVSPVANLSNPGLARKVDAAIVKQRHIDAVSLDTEISAWIERRTQEGSEDFDWDSSGSIVLPIIVSGKSAYSAVAGILHFVIDDQPRK